MYYLFLRSDIGLQRFFSLLCSPLFPLSLQFREHTPHRQEHKDLSLHQNGRLLLQSQRIREIHKHRSSHWEALSLSAQFSGLFLHEIFLKRLPNRFRKLFLNIPKRLLLLISSKTPILPQRHGDHRIISCFYDF